MVPVIDMSRVDREGKRALAASIAQACEEIGFFTITGHGVPEPVIAAMREVSTAFFDLPLDHKSMARRPHQDHNRGYFSFGELALARSQGVATPPDRKELFSMGRALVPSASAAASEAASIHFAPNCWPRDFPAMQPVWERYFAALLDLSARLMQLFALAVQLPEHHFDPLIGNSPSTLAAINYFDTGASAESGQLRAGEHTDYGTLTILLSENKPGGLQVRTRAGDWIDVVTVPNSFVINIGDLMERWTNDRWLSNMHRVANPPPDAAGSTRRQSIVFFHNANFDALVECIPNCRGDAPARHPPILAGEHRLAKNRRARNA